MEKISEIRKNIKTIASEIYALKENRSNCECAVGEDRGEVLANLTLAYRHLEDAAMRLGKTIQAFDGGVSVYDKERP